MHIPFPTQFFYSGVPWEMTARHYVSDVINAAKLPNSQNVTAKDVCGVCIVVVLLCGYCGTVVWVLWYCCGTVAQAAVVVNVGEGSTLCHSTLTKHTKSTPPTHQTPHT